MIKFLFANQTVHRLIPMIPNNIAKNINLIINLNHSDYNVCVINHRKIIIKILISPLLPLRIMLNNLLEIQNKSHDTTA